MISSENKTTKDTFKTIPEAEETSFFEIREKISNKFKGIIQKNNLKVILN